MTALDLIGSIATALVFAGGLTLGSEWLRANGKAAGWPE